MEGGGFVLKRKIERSLRGGGVGGWFVGGVSNANKGGGGGVKKPPNLCET